MNRIHIEKEIEFPAPEFDDISLDITADYIPEDEEWLLKAPNYLEIIEVHFNLAKQRYIRYIDNKLLDMTMDGEPQKWAAEEERQAAEKSAEDQMQEEFDRE